MTGKHEQTYNGQLIPDAVFPLSIKIRMTQYRIREWVNYYGTDSVYSAFSGGKDSSILLQMNFRQVIIKYGYPMIGKEVAG